MKPISYRITREEYYNEFGKGTSPSFYVQELRPFLFFWKRWLYIKHEQGVYQDFYTERTSFNSMLDAKNFIKEVLINEVSRQKVSKMVIETYDNNSI